MVRICHAHHLNNYGMHIWQNKSWLSPPINHDPSDVTSRHSLQSACFTEICNVQMIWKVILLMKAICGLRRDYADRLFYCSAKINTEAINHLTIRYMQPLMYSVLQMTEWLISQHSVIIMQIAHMLWSALCWKKQWSWLALLCPANVDLEIKHPRDLK